MEKGGKEEFFNCTWGKNMIFAKKRGGGKNINYFENLYNCFK